MINVRNTTSEIDLKVEVTNKEIERYLYIYIYIYMYYTVSRQVLEKNCNLRKERYNKLYNTLKEFNGSQPITSF